MKKILFWLFLLFFIITHTHVLASEFRILTHNSKNQVRIKDGIYYGINNAGKRAFYIELVKILLKEMDYPIAIEDVPFPRGLLWVQTTDNCIFFAVQRTQNRENTVKWVGPISTASDYFYEWKQRPTKITKIKDATNLRICVLNKSVHDEHLSKIGFTQLLKHSDYTICFDLLKHGRVDLAITSPDTLQDKLEAIGIQTEDVKSTGVMVLEGRIYIAFSNNIPDKEVDKWSTALDELKRSGKYKNLISQYLPH